MSSSAEVAWFRAVRSHENFVIFGISGVANVFKQNGSKVHWGLATTPPDRSGRLVLGTSLRVVLEAFGNGNFIIIFKQRSCTALVRLEKHFGILAVTCSCRAEFTRLKVMLT